MKTRLLIIALAVNLACATLMHAQAWHPGPLAEMSDGAKALLSVSCYLALLPAPSTTPAAGQCHSPMVPMAPSV